MSIVGDGFRQDFDGNLTSELRVARPDGKNIVFSRFRAGKWSLRRKTVDGIGAESQLLESNEILTPMAWARDGRIVYQQRSGGQLDLKMSSPQTLFDSGYAQPGPDFGGELPTPTPSVATASAS